MSEGLCYVIKHCKSCLPDGSQDCNFHSSAAFSPLSPKKNKQNTHLKTKPEQKQKWIFSLGLLLGVGKDLEFISRCDRTGIQEEDRKRIGCFLDFYLQKDPVKNGFLKRTLF